MAFPKAIQNTHSVEYQKLVEEKLLHSAEKKAYYKIRTAYMYSADPMERLKFYEAKERHSRSCKRIQAAQEEYKRALALKVLKDKGFDVSTETLMRLAELEIPTSMKELMRQVKQDNSKAVAMTDPEARELISQLDTPEHKSLKEQFLREYELADEATIPDGPLTMDESEIL
jgi:hypothetical protein